MKCFLVCQNNTHDPVLLPDNKPILIGRSPLTRIVDKRCSRHQLEFTADYENRKVLVKQVGNNGSAIGTKELGQGKAGSLTEDVVVFVLTGQYPHLVKFSHSTKSRDQKKNSVSPMLKRNSVDRESLKRKTSDLKRVGTKKLKTDAEQDNGSSKKKIEKRDEGIDDEEDDAHVNEVNEKLKKMKEMAKLQPPPAVAAGNDKKLAKPKIHHKCGKPATESNWSQIGKLLMYIRKGVESRSKIAGFDIDGCIIGTLSGKVFPTHSGDWKILFGETPTKLRKLHNDGYKIVFFTNQLGVSRGKTKVEDLKTKFTAIVDRIGLPIQIMVSTGGGLYRKPSSGMWHYLTERANDGIEVDMDSSLYVGDAAGRPEKWSASRKKDFSCSDRLFALNLGLKFYTPEEFFQGWKPASFKLPEFNPKSLKEDSQLTSPAGAKIASTKQEVVVTVGFPASGKTFFAKTYLESTDYVHVNRDKMGTWQKCVAACTKALQQNHSVVVDNTSPDKESRKRYIDVTKKLGVPCRCFYFTASHDQARHNERFREMTDKSHKPINDMVMNSYRSKFEEPSLSEGFSEVIKVNFVPKFTDPEHRRMFFQYLLDK